MLRLDWNNLFTLVNLLVLALLLKKFLFRPVHQIIGERQAQADTLMSSAREMEAESARIKKEYEETARQTELARGAELARARQNAAETYELIVAQARKKAETIVAAAEKNAEEERRQMLQSAEAELTDMVMSAVEEMVGESRNAQGDRVIYDRFLSRADNGATAANWR